jgi:hypothetical protein
MARKVGQVISRGDRRWLIRVIWGTITKLTSVNITIEPSTARCGKRRHTRELCRLDHDSFEAAEMRFMKCENFVRSASESSTMGSDICVLPDRTIIVST